MPDPTPIPVGVRSELEAKGLEAVPLGTTERLREAATLTNEFLASIGAHYAPADGSTLQARRAHDCWLALRFALAAVPLSENPEEDEP